MRREVRRPNAGDLAALGVSSVRRPDVYLSAVAKAVGVIEEAMAGQTTCDGGRAIGGEGHRRDQIREPVPVGHAFIGNAP